MEKLKNPYIRNIFESNVVYDTSGKAYPLDSNIDLEEGLFIQKCIKYIQPKNTIEIGCAKGISSLFICDALGNQNTLHTIVDPFQTTDWKGIGINNLKKAGFANIHLIEKGSEIALPELLAQEKSFELAFIDGWHTFDQTLLDFYYLNRMLPVGGIIIIDDVGMEAVNRCLRYILNYPAYKYFGKANVIPTTLTRKLFNIFASLFAQCLKIASSRVSQEILNDRRLRSDRFLGINSSMVAVQKTGDDQRPWNWYQPF